MVAAGPALRPILAKSGEPMDWSSVFATALPYTEFLDRHATPPQRARWDAMNGRINLEPAQLALLGGFVRRMPVLVIAGVWCGDCVNQCTIFDHFARGSSVIDLRFLDRDAVPEASDALSINGSRRVPVALFLNEDFQETARYGERTLSTYRRVATEQLGAACPTGIVPPSEDATRLVAQEWLNEFERAQLILRLSPKFRERYAD